MLIDVIPLFEKFARAVEGRVWRYRKPVKAAD